MKLPYFTESAYHELFDSVALNLNKYTESSTNDWVIKKFLSRNYFKESRIESSLPNLSFGADPNTEFGNVIVVYDSLKDKLSPKQASNPYLWSYLTHCYYWDYVIDRWFSDDNAPSVEKIHQRFFCGSDTGSRVGLLRNAISRFWWSGYLTYQEDKRNPYELTRLLFSHTDLTQSILERKFSMNKNVTIGILSAIKEINDDPGLANVGTYKGSTIDQNQHTYEWRELCKYINRFGAVTLLDTLSEEEIKKLSKEYLLNLRN